MMQGYLYMKNSDSVSENDKITAPSPASSSSLAESSLKKSKWSKRYCSLMVDSKRGPFIVARKRIEENYDQHKERLEDALPFASSLLNLANYKVSVLDDISSVDGSVCGGIIRCVDNNSNLDLDTVELRDKNREIAGKWVTAMKSAQESFASSSKSGVTTTTTTTTTVDKENAINTTKKNNNAGNNDAKAKVPGLSVKFQSADVQKSEYKAAVEKFREEQIKQQQKDKQNQQNVSENMDSDYKEHLKQKAESQVLMIESRRRHLEEKKQNEKEEKKRLERDDKEHEAQKEMEKLLAEAESREKDMQRLITESQLQAQNAQDIAKKSENDIQKLLEAANGKKQLAEQLSIERAEEERDRQIRMEMMKQLEAQRKEREAKEREKLIRQREQDEVHALKLALEKKLKNGKDSNFASNPVFIGISAFVMIACLIMGGFFLSNNSNKNAGQVHSYGSHGSFIELHAPRKTDLLSRGFVEGALEDWALPQTKKQVSSTLEVLQNAPRDELMAALKTLSGEDDNKSVQAQAQNKSHLHNNALVHGNVFKSLMRVIFSPLRAIRYVAVKFIKLF